MQGGFYDRETADAVSSGPLPLCRTNPIKTRKKAAHKGRLLLLSVENRLPVFEGTYIAEDLLQLLRHLGGILTGS